MVTDDAENHQLSFGLCRRAMMLDSFKDEPALKYEIEKKKYIYWCGVCQKLFDD